MGKRPPATPEQRAEAVAIYADHGPTEAGRQTGWDKSVISRWAKAAGVSTVVNAKTTAATEAIRVKREHRREELRTQLIEKAVDLLGRMDEPHIDFKGKDADEVTYPKPSPQGCQAYATAAAILLDKFRLEVGEATSRSEHRTTDQLDREIARLLETAA